MSEWQDISTAPKDGKALAYLRSRTFAPNQPFYWDKRKKRWATKLPTMMGFVDGFWDGSAEQPTQWAPSYHKASA